VHVDGDVSELVVETAVGLSISGRVTAGDDDEPVPAGTVVSADPDDRSRLRATAGADGAFRIAPVAREQVTLYAAPPPHSGLVGTSEPCGAGTRTARLALRGAARLFGVVVDERDEPVSGRAWISASDPDAPPRFDATAAVDDGRMSFEGIPAGTWDVFVRTTGGLFALAAGVDVVADGPDAGRLVAVPGASLEVAGSGRGPMRGDGLAPRGYAVMWRSMPVGWLDGRPRIAVPEGDLAVGSPSLRFRDLRSVRAWSRGTDRLELRVFR
jgi:hypothetical protein